MIILWLFLLFEEVEIIRSSMYARPKLRPKYDQKLSIFIYWLLLVKYEEVPENTIIQGDSHSSTFLISNIIYVPYASTPMGTRSIHDNVLIN